MHNESGFGIKCIPLSDGFAHISFGQQVGPSIHKLLLVLIKIHILVLINAPEKCS